MTALTALPRAIVNAGLREEVPEKKKRKQKNFKCHRCGGNMEIIDGTNVMACQGNGDEINCNNYYVFK